MVTAAQWSERADAAEAAVLDRHLRRVWGIPGTALGVVGWPARWSERSFLLWDYWWQAHLIDCAIDAAVRAPSPDRRERIARIARGQWTRNLRRWTNDYNDDMAWLALALERAQRTQQLDFARPIEQLTARLYDAWAPEVGGGIAWRVWTDFYNAPANGPAGLALAHADRMERAVQMADWIAATLCDRATGLVFDGIHLPSRRLERPIYSYCQGVVLGLEIELAIRTGDERHRKRVRRLLDAVAEHLTRDHVIVGGGGHDGGLFNGILARYLASIATQLPDDSETAAVAGSIVLNSAAAAWHNRLDLGTGPLFGPDWSRPARPPRRESRMPERDLSVQLGGWMVVEAAFRVSNGVSSRPR
ncbi:MAG: fructose-bisphosphate aldolase [Aldersonia sp.]|nr:fructose-bisphosphate aldolase [Aldersonia sp.]